MIGFSINPDPTPQEKEERGRALMESIDQAIQKQALSLRESVRRQLSMLIHSLPCKVCDGKGTIGQIRHYSHDNPLLVMCEDCHGTGVDGLNRRDNNALG